MVDIEPEIFSLLYNAIVAEYPDCAVTGEEARIPSSFPTVHIEETNNYADKNAIDSAGEFCTNLTYTINIYTNDATGKKAKAKSILALIDTELTALNFTRTSVEPSFQKYTEYYRLIARYSASVNKDKIIARR